MRQSKSNAASQTDDVVLGKRSSEEANHANDVPPASAVSSEHARTDTATTCSTRIVEGLLRLTVDNVRNMTDTVRSDPKVINDVPWKIMVMPRQHTVSKKSTQRCLGFFLQCCPNSYSDSWSCQASAELRMLAQKPGVSNFVRKTSHEYTSKENDWGYSCFMTWADVLDENQGYILKGSITLEVLVRAEPPKGILSHDAFVKKIEEYIRLADLQCARGLIDKAIEVNMSAAKFCKDKDLEVKDRLEMQRVALIKQKLHQSIERIENYDKNPKEANDFHTLNSLRHALVGNISCTKNGHHKGAYKDKSGTIRTLQHTCHISKDGKCKVRHVKKTMAVPLCKNKGIVNDEEVKETISRDSTDLEKMNQWTESVEDTDKVHVKDVLENILDQLSDADSQSTMHNNGFVDDDYECNMAVFDGEAYSCGGITTFEDTIEFENCGACYTETLASFCPELQDQLPSHLIRSQAPMIKARKSSMRASSLQHQVNPLQSVEAMALKMDNALKMTNRHTNRMSVQEVMEYFKEEFSNKSGSIRTALGRVGVSATNLEEAGIRLQNGGSGDGGESEERHASGVTKKNNKGANEAPKQQQHNGTELKGNNTDAELVQECKHGRAAKEKQSDHSSSPEPNAGQKSQESQDNLNALKTFLKQTDFERTKLIEQCKRLDKTNNQLHASLSSANEKLEKANQMLKERRAEMKKLEKRVKQESSLANENANLAKKLEAAESELREVRSKAEEGRRRLADENRRLLEAKKSMQKELNYSSSEVERLQCLLEEKQAALNAIEKERNREKTNHQTALKEATERAKRAEVVILELRLEQGLKLLTRAHEECQFHLAQFDEIAKKHASAISPTNMKTLTTFQQDWSKAKASISELMQKSKTEFQHQIEAVNSGKTLSSLPTLEVPKPPPQPGLPRICLSRNPQPPPPQRQSSIPPIGRPAASLCTPIGSGKSTSGSSGGSLSPSKPESRYENGPVVTSSYAAAAIADRSYQSATQQGSSVTTAGSQRHMVHGSNVGGGLLQQQQQQTQPAADVQQPWLNGKAFGTLFDSFACTSGDSSPNISQWTWNSGCLPPPAAGASPVQSVSDYSSTPNSTRPPSRGPSRCSPLFPGMPKWNEHVSSFQSAAPFESTTKVAANCAEPLLTRILSTFPTLSVQEVQNLLEECRLMQASKSLKGLTIDTILSHINQLMMAKNVRPPSTDVTDKAMSNGHVMSDNHLNGCFLCKQNYRSNSSVTSLVCRHRFHSSCIQKWMAKKQCCPICAMNNFSHDEYPALN